MIFDFRDEGHPVVSIVRMGSYGRGLIASSDAIIFFEDILGKFFAFYHIQYREMYIR